MDAGHGYFGKYLCQVARRKPDTSGGHSICIAHHTLEEFPACQGERQELSNEIGSDLRLSIVIEKMCRREVTWSIVTSFCESVITQKESAERQREEDVNAVQIRRCRIGRRNQAVIAHFHIL